MQETEPEAHILIWGTAGSPAAGSTQGAVPQAYAEIFSKSPLEDPRVTRLRRERRPQNAATKPNCHPWGGHPAVHSTLSAHARGEPRGSGDAAVQANLQETGSSRGQGLQPSEPPAPAPPFELGLGALPWRRGLSWVTSLCTLSAWATGGGAPVCTPPSLNMPRNGPSRRGFPVPPTPPGMLRFTLSETHTFKSLPLSGLEGTRKEPLNMVLHWVLASERHWCPVRMSPSP